MRWYGQRILCVAGVAVWLTASGLGFAWLAWYETQPGAAGHPTTLWPPEARLSRAASGWTLVVFLHPHCPCSQATLTELAALRAPESTPWEIAVVFCRPEGVPAGWERTDLWDRAAALPRTRLWSDTSDQERRRFGAVTSGHVLLYDPTGRLRYSGGLTRARGQTGNNVGRAAVESLLRGEPASTSTFPVFGCPLTDEPTSTP